MTSICSIDYSQTKKSSKRDKKEEYISLFSNSFLEQDVNKKNIKISEALKKERISQINFIKIRTLNCMIMNLENTVNAMKETRKVLINIINLINVSYL